ncbi:MAG: hypothetical protein GC164_03880 [Phycisphaera sp.]|nr:hypothetical protein [Phycisphaera sp.]
MPDRRTLIAFCFGLLCCLTLWVAVPYNNFALNNSFISDGYLPEIVVFFLAILVMVVNPLLRRWFPGGALGQPHKALICGMLLFAAIIPSNGLFRFFPHCLALDTEQINQSPVLAPAIANSSLPASLFPDKVGLNEPTPIASQLVDELDPGKSIPWSAWVGPTVAWGTFIVAFWVLMVGMGLMVFPQWLHVERLNFPLLRIYNAILDDPGQGHNVPPIFKSKLFWVGCITIFLIHSTNGLNIFTRGNFPLFPVSWDLSSILTEGVWRYTPGFLKSTRLYFLFIGLSYFMANRYSFSMWFTVLFFGLFMMYAQMYMPTFNAQAIYDQGSGALIAMVVGVIWLGRQHYLRTMRATLGLGTADQRGDAIQAMAGRMFLLGGVVMFAWYLWAGAGLGWAIFFVVTAVLIMLMVTRIVAETGFTYVWIIPFTAGRFIDIMPSKWSTVASSFLQSAHYILVNRASAVSAAAMTVLALGLSPWAEGQTQRRTAGLGMTILVVGFVVCGAVHLYMGYHMTSSLDSVNTPITGRGAQIMDLSPVADAVSGRDSPFEAGRFRTVLLGVSVAGVLLFLCGRYPAWPLHPIGLIFVYSSIGQRIMMSLFVGWLLKVLIVQFGGARTYRAAMPLFLGMIFGEVFANAFWTMVPAVQILLGADPATVQHMAIFQYT